MNDSPGQRNSARLGFVIVTVITVMAVASQCNKDKDLTPPPVPVISINP